MRLHSRLTVQLSGTRVQFLKCNGHQVHFSSSLNKHSYIGINQSYFLATNNTRKRFVTFTVAPFVMQALQQHLQYFNLHKECLGSEIFEKAHPKLHRSYQQVQHSSIFRDSVGCSCLLNRVQSSLKLWCHREQGHFLINYGVFSRKKVLLFR